jgi:hypothetical protein
MGSGVGKLGDFRQHLFPILIAVNGIQEVVDSIHSRYNSNCK